eukprot:COSAG01_NODE_26_length_36857_cov_31.426166_29_plen_221_part_00
MLLPPEIGRLSNLEEIDLRSNILSVLPDEFCQLRQLERAVLSHAFLPSRNQLPYCFGELTSLSSLEAANAGLFLVSDDQGNDYPDLSRLPLVNIDLSHNRLGPDLPSWLNANRTTAPLLRSLNLADNVSARPLAFSALHAVKVAVSCARGYSDLISSCPPPRISRRADTVAGDHPPQANSSAAKPAGSLAAGQPHQCWRLCHRTDPRAAELTPEHLHQCS